MANYSEIEQLKIDVAAKEYAKNNNGDFNRNYVAFQKGADFTRSSKDEFAMNFAEFIGKNNYRKMGSMWTGWDFEGIKTTEELLTIYKNSLNASKTS